MKVLCWVFFFVTLLNVASSSLSLMMSSASRQRIYDVVIVGGGSAGLTAAKFAASFKKTVVIVEKDRLGGDCTWTGCVPSKSLIACSKVAHSSRHGWKLGISSTNVSVDFSKVRTYLRSNMEKIYQRDDSPEALANLGVEVINGEASFESRNVLKVMSADGVKRLEAASGIILATGARAVRPTERIPGLDTVNYATYEEIFDLESLPTKLTVIGGGPIGSELAQTFSRLGSKVTQIAASLISKEEPEARESLEAIFKDEGIVRVKGILEKVTRSGEGHHIATCILQDGTSVQVEGDLLLVAVGRVPNAKGLNLEEMGIQFKPNGGIDVNERLQTSVKNVYAAGDCTGDRQFTHYAGYQGAIAARNILLPLSDPGIMGNVPATTFTSPEIASVGLSELNAKEKYGEMAIIAISEELDNVDRAICDGEARGFIKIVCLKKNYKILGATIVAPVAGEMISEIFVAMQANLSFDQLAKVMHPYPAYSLALQTMAADVYYQKLTKSKPLYDFLKFIGL